MEHKQNFFTIILRVGVPYPESDSYIFITLAKVKVPHYVFVVYILMLKKNTFFTPTCPLFNAF